MSFKCENECGNSECCPFIVIHSYYPLLENIDRKYYKAKGIDLYEKQLSKNMKYVAFKIPFQCKLLINNRCSDYDNRPDTCESNGGGNKHNPFRVQSCPYFK